ncbi:MBL fold metallo-hydrolase [Paenibacillus lutimineralis]|uniref:MBL fold metallo-hydrolase n=1 Tax=Paenibacillus lutimineralis TaxID=2707005 RepID=A0A3Q9IB32_9BACL|nr:MBL fold metallo-hydrolase [Paenibacillus lutimineralis]AZS15159.1 MBL fold metallo-hydrolase [Paenibacillus lutimineralis]
MELKIWGGAGEHGRSCYVLTGEQHRIMLDCGVKKEGTGQYPLLDVNLIPELTAVFLSHAHEDHSMALPLLYKHGYQGEIWTTRPTVSQLGLYFANWGKYVASRNGELPYEPAHISALRFRILEEGALAGQWLQLDDGLRLQWGRSGHMLGSVWFRIQMEGQQLFFSGDFSRESALLAADPPCTPRPESPTASTSSMSETVLSIMDNAYGMDEESQEQKMNALQQFILEVLGRGGHVLLPVPAFGRGQELLVWMLSNFPNQPILLERAIYEGLRQMAEWEAWLRPGSLHSIEEAINVPHVHVPGSQEERLQLLEGEAPFIIFTTDGMMESPRARWYAERLSLSSAHAIVITGHASQGTFARRLLRGETEETYCETVQMGYKIHQGLEDVRYMLQEVPSRHTVLVHAPKLETDRVIVRLAGEGYPGLHSLQAGDVLQI